jgi:hypothetical protein
MSVQETILRSIFAGAAITGAVLTGDSPKMAYLASQDTVDYLKVRFRK